MTHARTTMRLSTKMKDTLANAVLGYDGSVYVNCWDLRTAKALERRGATSGSFSSRLCLDMTLTLAAVQAHSDDRMNNIDRTEYVDLYCERETERYGHFDSGYADSITAEGWRRVREGLCTAERGTVSGWGAAYEGWIFSPSNA